MLQKPIIMYEYQNNNKEKSRFGGIEITKSGKMKIK